MSGQQKRRTAGSVIASVFLAILLFAPLTLGIVWWELRDVLSQEGTEYCLDSIDLEKIRLSDVGAGREGTLLDKLAGSLNETFGTKKVTAAVLKEKIEASTVKAFLAGEAGDFFEDLKNGTSRAAVTAEDVSAFVEENWHLLEDLIPVIDEKDLSAAADTVIAGDVETGFAETVQDHLKKHDVPEKYDGMIQRYQETGKVEEADRDLLTEFLTKELFPGMYKDMIAEKLAGEAAGKLNMAYLRSEMGAQEKKAFDTAFSVLPLYVVIGVIAVLVLLLFVANRRIPGDAFVWIGVLLLTVCGNLAASGLLHGTKGLFWRSLAEDNYLAYALSGALLGYHQTRNLIIAAAGLGLIILGIVLNRPAHRRAQEADPLTPA